VDEANKAQVSRKLFILTVWKIFSRILEAPGCGIGRIDH
jgi:hypothetical protein